MVLSGTHAVLTALERGVGGDLYISTLHPKLSQIRSANFPNVRLHELSREQCAKRTIRQNIQLITSQEAGVPSHIKDWLASQKSRKELLVLIADHVQDAQNLGAIFRSAALFDVHLIVLPKRRAAQINEYASRTASGAVSIVPHCLVSNLASVVALLKEHGFWIYALELEGKDIGTVSFSARTALILGSESSGVSRLLHEKSDVYVHIPTSQALDSLNVSVSAGIACYEYRKQYPLLR